MNRHYDQLFFVYTVLFRGQFIGHLRAHPSRHAKKTSVHGFVLPFTAMDLELEEGDKVVMPSMLSHEDLLKPENIISLAANQDETGFTDEAGKFTPLHIEPGECFCYYTNNCVCMSFRNDLHVNQHLFPSSI